MLWFLRIVAVLLSFHGAIAGMYSKTNVLQLTAKNFKREVLRNDNVTVVEFYAPWCGHCKNLAPEYIKSANSLNGIVRVGAVNCDAPGNKALCAHYGVEGFPTIKVFQPAKKSDVDFKDAVEDKALKKTPHQVYTYKGPREAKAINKFAIGKLRNYAATLAGQASFLWLKTNGIPRVVMLPGSKYKSKSIAPLFKVLSNEYFGKVRFAYIPRRADGAWNLLGIKAPEESQIVYMADDRGSIVYQGKLTKNAVKNFIDEQYNFEMERREARGEDTRPDRDAAAEGFEWISEDQQDAELEHVVKAREAAEADRMMFEENKRRVKARRDKERAEAEGREYIPEPEPETPSSVAAAEPIAATGAVPTDAELVDEFQPDSEAVEEAEIDDDAAEEANIDDADDALDLPAEGIEKTETSEDIDAILDEIEIDLEEEDMVEEGPDAVAAWQARVEEQNAALLAEAKARESLKAKLFKKRQDENKLSSSIKKSATTVVDGMTPPPGITPKPSGESNATDSEVEDPRLKNMDMIVRHCIRREEICILLASTEGFREDDIHVVMHARGQFPAAINQKLIWQYFVDSNEDLQKIAEDFGLSPYGGERTTRKGVKEHIPGMVLFDFARRAMTVMEPGTDFTSSNVVTFVAKYMNKKTRKSVKQMTIPREYVLWVTEEDLDVLEMQEQANLEAAEVEAAVKAASTDAKDEL